MATTVITPDQDAIVCEIEIVASSARVFRAITERQQVEARSLKDAYELTDWAMELRKGGVWRSITKEKATGREYAHHGNVLEIDPPHLLVHAWFANFHDDPNRETMARWELTPTASGTKVKLTHSGLGAEPTSRADYSMGWPGVLEEVKKYVQRNK